MERKGEEMDLGKATPLFTATVHRSKAISSRKKDEEILVEKRIAKCGKKVVCARWG